MKVRRRVLFKYMYRNFLRCVHTNDIKYTIFHYLLSLHTKDFSFWRWWRPEGRISHLDHQRRSEATSTTQTTMNCKKSRETAVECRYNAAQYCKVLHKWFQELTQNINQMLDTQKISHTSPLRGSYGVSSLNICEEIDRIITALNCKIYHLRSSSYVYGKWPYVHEVHGSTKHTNRKRNIKLKHCKITGKTFQGSWIYTKMQISLGDSECKYLCQVELIHGWMM